MKTIHRHQYRHLSRRDFKRFKDAERLRLKNSGWGGAYSKCYDCGGQKPWCSACEVYTQTCCVDYGTCMCS